MSKNKLGRGLSALLPEKTANDPSSSELQNIPVDKIKTNPYQPRLIFKADSILELADSIKENGLIQPIVLRKIENGYELISGERRLRAAKHLGHTSIPSIIKNQVSDKESMLMSLIENIQREDITPIEQAECYKKIMEENKITQAELAEMIGKSRPAVANTIRLLELSPKSKKALESGTISEGHARKLLQLSTHEAQDKMLIEISANNMTVRDIETRIISKKTKKSAHPSPLSIKNDNYRIICKKKGEIGSFVINFKTKNEYENLLMALEAL
jgi:ParB family chromosome partitioning protein